jgi:hypothetical protein
MRHAHDRAFVVAKATSLDLLKDIRDSLSTGIEKGQSYQTWAKGLTPTLQAKGWWGKQMVTNPQTGEEKLSQLGSQRRLGIIYDTNMRTAYAAGHYAKDMEVAESMPYWTYVHGYSGTPKKPRPQHVAMDGLTFRYNDPFWAINYPPNGYRCDCGKITEDAIDIKRRTGKEPDDVVLKSSPEDFNTKIVQVQEKDIPVTGYRIPGTQEFIYPQPGFDYAPGDFDWRTKQMLSDKVQELPEGNIKQAFQEHLDGAVKRNFSQYMSLLKETFITRGETLAVGILEPPQAEAVAQKLIQTKTGTRSPNLVTPLLLARDKELAHAIRDIKTSKGVAMPEGLLAQLPDLLTTYEKRWDKTGALQFFSEPFQEVKQSDAPKWRWKIVFKPQITPQGEQMRFVTATKVGASAQGLGEALP